MPRKRASALSTVQVGFIGAGDLANRMHYPSLVEMPDVRIAALCDLVEEKREKTAKFFDVKKTYGDYRRMLDEVKCDAVYCVMPPHHLYDVAADVLARGLPLFVEKPPAVTTFQTQALAEHARRNKCLTMAGFNRRFAPLNVLAKELVEKKGPINQVQSVFHKFHTGGYYYRGAIDILRSDAIHAVDVLRWIGGEVRTIASAVSSFDDGQPNSWNAVVRFESGAAGILSTNWMTGRRYLGMELHAAGASAYVETEVKMSVYEDNDLAGKQYDAVEVAKSSEIRFVGGYYQENRHFIDCVKAGRMPMTNLDDAAKSMALADRIYASSI
ncbi:MAG: Gfo/Idh/MocA family oxidoreductase [Planctomycetota bacterium]